jgi:glycosyltransferase involved in cell wall biosynthesis
MEKRVRLSAVVLIGTCRDRAQRVLNALYAQSSGADMEIVVVDLAPDETPALALRPEIPTRYVRRPRGEPWGPARAAGFRATNGEIVAFIEDHCYPAPGWAAALLAAHQGPWASVGYAFVNANPQTYMSRAGFVADYGPWQHPVLSGPAELLPGNNVSYKREALERFDSELDAVLSPDFNMHETLRRNGYQLYMEAGAIAAHENFNKFSDLGRANHWYCRLLAVSRARSGRWSASRRIFYGLAVPLGAPLIKGFRLVRSLRSRPQLWRRTLAASPVIVATYYWSAIGESLGYLFGEGAAAREFNRWELETLRTV